jgi:uncharacterized protein YpmS
MKKNRPIILLILLLVFSTLACQINIGGPQLPDRRIQTDSNAAQSAKDVWHSSLENAPNGGLLAFTLTEEQLTSLIDAYLKSKEDTLLTNPQVFLRDNRIEFYGTVQKGYFDANIHLSISATIDENSQPKIEIIETELGPVPDSDDIKKAISGLINEALTGSILPNLTGIKLETIDISNGMLTITAQRL